MITNNNGKKSVGISEGDSRYRARTLYSPRACVAYSSLSTILWLEESLKKGLSFFRRVRVTPPPVGTAVLHVPPSPQ